MRHITEALVVLWLLSTLLDSVLPSSAPHSYHIPHSSAFQSRFPSCHNALNTQIHSLLVMTLPVFIRSSGIHGVWLWKSRWHLSTLCRTGPLHSHTSGKSPARANPSCVVWYRLPPDGALVCRFWSRSGEHNKTHQCSLMTVGMGLLHVLLYEASWSVAFLDSAIPGHGWNSDHGCDLYAGCHPELGYVG